MPLLDKIPRPARDFFRTAGTLFRKTVDSWLDDNAPRLGAAIAFYTVSSLAPLLIIAIGFAALFFGEKAAEGRIVVEMQNLVGKSGAEALQTMLAGARQHSSGFFPSLLGILTLLVTSTGLFVELQSSLNSIWNVRPDPGANTLLLQLKSRLLSFGLVLGVGFLLLVSLLVSAVISAVGETLRSFVPDSPWLLQFNNQLLSFGIITLLFAMMYKVLPDVQIRWRDVWVGAAVTAVLFTLGKFLIGLYLGRSSVTSAYGAAGSFVIVLLWIYYSALIFFFGAEFTKSYVQRHGASRPPKPAAVVANDLASNSATPAVAQGELGF